MRCAPSARRRARFRGFGFAVERWPAPLPAVWRSIPRRWQPAEPGRPRSAPEVLQGVRRLVVRPTNPQVRRYALAQLPVYFRDAGFAVQLKKAVPLRKVFEFPLDHGLITDERLEE